MGLVGILAFLLSYVANLETLIPTVIPFALLGLLITCIGGLQALTGRAWGENPQWVRVVFLIVAIPVVLTGLMVIVGLLASAFHSGN